MLWSSNGERAIFLWSSICQAHDAANNSSNRKLRNGCWCSEAESSSDGVGGVGNVVELDDAVADGAGDVVDAVGDGVGTVIACTSSRML